MSSALTEATSLNSFKHGTICTPPRRRQSRFMTKVKIWPAEFGSTSEYDRTQRQSSSSPDSAKRAEKVNSTTNSGPSWRGGSGDSLRDHPLDSFGASVRCIRCIVSFSPNNILILRHYKTVGVVGAKKFTGALSLGAIGFRDETKGPRDEIPDAQPHDTGPRIDQGPARRGPGEARSDAGQDRRDRDSDQDAAVRRHRRDAQRSHRATACGQGREGSPFCAGQ